MSECFFWYWLFQFILNLTTAKWFVLLQDIIKITRFSINGNKQLHRCCLAVNHIEYIDKGKFVPQTYPFPWGIQAPI